MQVRLKLRKLKAKVLRSKNITEKSKFMLQYLNTHSTGLKKHPKLTRTNLHLFPVQVPEQTSLSETRHPDSAILEAYLEKHFKVVPIQRLCKHPGKDYKVNPPRNGYPIEIFECIPKPYNLATFQIIRPNTICEILWSALTCRRKKEWNYIMPTGKNSDCVVLDFDDYKEGKEVKLLFKTFPFIEALAPHCKTSSGGHHIYLPYLPFVRNTKTRGIIDVQSDGSLIVLPPSITISKVTGKPNQYQWLRSPGQVTKQQWEYLRMRLLEELPKFYQLYPETRCSNVSSNNLKYIINKPKIKIKILNSTSNKPFLVTFRKMFGLIPSEPISLAKFNDGIKFSLEGYTCLVRNCIHKQDRKHSNPGKSSITIYPNGYYRIHCWCCDRNSETVLPKAVQISKLCSLISK